MKIKSIRLHPFAGIQDKKIEFTDGFNLLIGPNEAGKSTLFQAIQIGLLQTTDLTTARLQNEIGNYFPIGGGDVVRVTLEIYKDNPEQLYTINKEWKYGNRNGSASFITSTGKEYTEEEKVQKEINKLLPATPGTMKEILMTHQSALQSSLSRIKDSEDARQEIGGILRKGVMEAGGVSVDKFKQQLDTRYTECFNNWDRDKNYPKTDAQGNDKGIHNRHIRNVGTVLGAWYNMESAKKKFEEIQQFEDEMDVLNAQLETIQKEFKEKSESYEEHKPMLEKQSERAVLESKKEATQHKFNEVDEAADLWPVYEFQLKEAEPVLKILEDKLLQLNEEQGKASNRTEFLALKKRIDQIAELEQNIGEAKKDLKISTVVTVNDLEQVRTLVSDIRQKEIQIQASKLSVKIEALQNAVYTIGTTKEERESVNLKQGEVSTDMHNGVFSLVTEQLKVQVTAGDQDLSSIVQELKLLEDQLKEKLNHFEAKDQSELNTLQKLYHDKANTLSALEVRHKEFSEGESLNDLRGKLEDFGDLAEVRELAIIQEERDKVIEQKAEQKEKFEKMTTTINIWKERYTDKNGLFTERANLTTAINDLNVQIQEMEALPDEFNSLDKFKEHVESLEKAVNELREEKQKLQIEVAGKEGEAPDISSEEQIIIKYETVTAFDKTHSKAESLARIKDSTDSILAKLEEQTYTPLIEGLTKWLSTMSDGRFRSIILDEEGKEVPSTFITEDNLALPFHLLSHGTKDLTSLAWKFAISEMFLKEQSGMILLDDPMVDMDPERKKLALNAVHEFSKNQQVILFTCHPGTEKAMNETVNTISLNVLNPK
ncbi:MAG: AAA family ATPase [Balneolaceae bacterium]